MSVQFNNLSYPTVVIIGGGFAGIELAKKLSHKPYKVFLLDKNNYHCFQPLLYQVATGGLGSDAIAYPLRKIIGPMPNVAFRMAAVSEVDTANQQVLTDVGNFHYDHLVIATGSSTNFFGNQAIEDASMPLKSIPQALDIRSDFLQEFEKAMVDNTLEGKKQALSFVIVGAGPTGVELAGAMAEIKRNVIPSDYRELDKELMSIRLIEAAPRVLSTMSEKSSADALHFLQEMGVEVKLNTTVLSYENEELSLNTGEKIKTDTVIWSAGVKGNVLKGFQQEEVVRGNRYQVDEYNRLVNHKNIYAIGDIASMPTKQYPNGHPMVAPVAMQQAILLGKNLVELSKNKPMQPFVYKDKGSMATIGRNKAVVDLPFVHFKGFFAWLVWMFVHLLLLIGFRNRLIVFVNWAWNYFSYERAIRLIIRPYKKKVPVTAEDPA